MPRHPSPRPSAPPAPLPRRRRVRPRVEVLEDRTVPTVLVVTSLSDAVAAGDGVTLREAVQAATTNTAVNEARAGEAAPDTIVFAASLQGGTITLAGSELLLGGGGDLSIVGPGGVAGGITLDGAQASRVLHVTAAADAVILMNLTLTRGNAGDADGGGLLNEGPNTTLSNALVTANRANAAPGARGGGIANTGVLTLADSTVSDNQASGYGGGLFNGEGTVTVNRSRISANRTDSFGGGIGSLGVAGQVTLTETTVDGNEATILGGGVASDGGTLALRRSTLSGNEAFIGGGGIDKGGGAVYLAGSTLAHNRTDFQGGGLRLLNTTVNIVNTTIAHNTSFDRAGGINQDGGTLTLSNSILSLNRAANTGDDRETTGGGTFFNNDSVEGGDPRLGPLQDNGGPTFTLAPLPDNPQVIDQGTNALAVDPFGGAILDTDQRGAGFPRIVGGTVDRGAVEFFSPRTAVSVAALQDGMPVTSTSAARRIDLRATVESGVAGIIPAGSVLFFDDPTPADPTDAPTLLGAIPLPLDAAGQATLPGVPLSAGTHNLFARFTPASEAFLASASPPRAVTARVIDTVGVFDPNAVFALLNQNTTTTTGPDFSYSFGFAGSLPVVGNWTGDPAQVSLPGVVRSAGGLLEWTLADENPPVLPNLPSFTFGASGQVPIAGDWDGDGITGVGVFDPGTATFSLSNSPGAGPADFTFVFGGPGFLPVVGDWDGRRGDEVGVYDPATGTWFLAADTPAAGFPTLLGSFPFGGGPGTRPIAGDWDGDGTDGIGVFGPTPAGFGQFLLRNTPDAGRPDVNGGDPILAGLSTWLPLSGNWGVKPLSGNPLLALLAAGGQGPGAAGIGAGELDFIVSSALARLEGAGWNPEAVQGLARAEYVVGPTPAGVLGYVEGGRVVLSPDGAGHGWYVDPTPEEDGDAFAGHDLLSAVLHEMGHLAGLGHDDGGLMAGSLPVGARPFDAIDALFARGLV